MDNTKLQFYAEQYFSSSNFLNKKILEDIANVRESYEDAWNGLEEKEKEQVINEHIIFPEVMIQHAKSQDQAKHQPSSFPRLKIRTGQKFIVEEGNSSQSDRNGTYSYRDEHSSPFGWKTRSQQNLNFDIYNSTETSSNSTDGLDVVAARRSTILSCPFGQYTRVPKVSKPVSIPVVPELPESKKKESEFPKDISEVTSLVSSIVIENENNIVLDFSAPVMTTIEDYYEESSICSTINSPAPSTPISARGESSSLLSKVRDKTASLKRSLTPTMKRKKSTTSMDTLSTTATECDSPDQTPTRICPRSSPNRVMKPACPPPPPPVARPVAPPPPPPSKNIEIKLKVVPPVPPQRDPTTRISTFVSYVADSNATEEDQTSDPPEKPQIPKTGFDFLDEW